MKVITISVGRNVQGVLVANNHEVDDVMSRLRDASNGLRAVSIDKYSPDTLEMVIDYLKGDTSD